ncbi:MAG TPA: collagen-like protein [Holophagaceae bacterium]|nr:collagen-like protein [Holophagaceae bacterium]
MAGTPGPAGPTGPQGATGSQGPLGPQGLTGLIGPTGAAGPAGVNGINGTNGLDGNTTWNGAGTPVATNAGGTSGDFYLDTTSNLLYGPKVGPSWVGVIGVSLVGPSGANGPQGLMGPAGPQGPTGLIGATGVQGPIGPAGATGSQGPIGATGPQGPSGLLAFGYFYALMPSDNTTTVAAGSAVSFPQNGAASGITRLSAGEFTLSAAGTYEVFWQVSIAEAGQLVLGINGTEQAYTVAGRATATSQITNHVLLVTTLPNSLLSVRNPSGNPVALTVTPSAGGALAVSASLLIKQIQ